MPNHEMLAPNLPYVCVPTFDFKILRYRVRGLNCTTVAATSTL